MTVNDEGFDHEAQELRHDWLLAALTVPVDDDRGTYSGRRLQAQWVKSREASTSSAGGAITGTSGWTAGAPADVFDLLTEGKPYILETVRFSQITGWIIDGRWYARKTDEDLEREHQEFVDAMRRERRERLEEKRAEWTARQDALPDWIRARLDTFHERGGEEFELEGWGYELVVAELVVLYADLGPALLERSSWNMSEIESDAIREKAASEGTSGNQHDIAIALAKRHLRDPDDELSGTVSALSPITGDPYYANGQTAEERQ